MHSHFQNAFTFILNLNVSSKFLLTACLFLCFLLVVFLRQNVNGQVRNVGIQKRVIRCQSLVRSRDALPH